MNEIKIFENSAFGKIRTAGTSEEPLFCAADVCKALGYANGRDAVTKHVDYPDVAKCDIGVVTGKRADGSDAIQFVTMTFVNESGLYALIFGSTMPQAKSFKHWVTSEILPSIRKTGSYNMPNFKNPAEAARAWADQYEKTLALEAKNKELKPKAQYFDALVERSLLTGFRDTAKELGLKQNEFIRILIDNGYVYKTPKGEIRPIAKYANDLFELKDFKSLHNEHAGVRTWITVKGKKVFQMLFGKH